MGFTDDLLKFLKKKPTKKIPGPTQFGSDAVEDLLRIIHITSANMTDGRTIAAIEVPPGFYNQLHLHSQSVLGTRYLGDGVLSFRGITIERNLKWDIVIHTVPRLGYCRGGTEQENS